MTNDWQDEDNMGVYLLDGDEVNDIELNDIISRYYNNCEEVTNLE